VLGGFLTPRRIVSCLCESVQKQSDTTAPNGLSGPDRAGRGNPLRGTEALHPSGARGLEHVDSLEPKNSE
jgi:hypothetical protein